MEQNLVSQSERRPQCTAQSVGGDILCRETLDPVDMVGRGVCVSVLGRTSVTASSYFLSGNSRMQRLFEVRC